MSAISPPGISHSDNASSIVLDLKNSLPNETLVAIFLNVSPAVLTSLARVCRQWRVVAEWYLYTNICISESLSSPFPGFPYNTTRCCKTIISHPHLAMGLRKFHLRWICNDYVDHSDPRLHITLSHISSVIGLSANLESLDLSLSLPSHPDYPDPSFPGGDVIFHSLRYLSLSGVGYLQYSRLLQLLRNMPSMQYLRLPDYDGDLSLHPHTLPSLTSFCGSPRAAATVLPGRPVQSLALVGQDGVTEADLSQMAKTSVPLRHLDLSAMQATLKLLRNVSRNLSMLESLKVKLALRYAGIPYQEALSHLLGAFGRLSAFDLSQTQVDIIALGNSILEQSFCHAWHSACPSLRRIVFPSQTEWTYQEEGDLWIPSPAEA